jgi:prophage regulatory protein
MFLTQPKEAATMARTAQTIRNKSEQNLATTQHRIFIKLAQVKALTTLSTSEIYRRMLAGKFPKQVTLGPKSVVWIESEVLAWCEDCISASRGEVA